MAGMISDNSQKIQNKPKNYLRPAHSKIFFQKAQKNIRY
jgi:hypothetical protein